MEQGGKPELALRFDLTVPLARYVAEHEHALQFPVPSLPDAARVSRRARAARALPRVLPVRHRRDRQGRLSVRYDAECRR
jgi:histidyl-tRNA synthetase